MTAETASPPPRRKPSGRGKPPTGTDTPALEVVPPAQPRFQIRMTSGTWRYSTADDDPADFRRGIYGRAGGAWEELAPLPYIHARVVRRDGSGRRTSVQYLMSATPDGERNLYTHLEIKTGEWANKMGIALSDDPKIVQAAGTAIRDLGKDHDLEREATVRVTDEGRVSVPVQECLPAGYLLQAPGDRADALAQWATITHVLARNPKVALALGASVVSPFIGALHPQGHFFQVYGDSDRGKSTTLKIQAGVWGTPMSWGTPVSPGTPPRSASAAS